jgi:hypothetical protein
MSFNCVPLCYVIGTTPLCIMTLSITTISKITKGLLATLGIMILRVNGTLLSYFRKGLEKCHSPMCHNAQCHFDGIRIHNMMTLSKITFSVKGLFVTLGINDAQSEWHSAFLF